MGRRALLIGLWVVAMAIPSSAAALPLLGDDPLGEIVEETAGATGGVVEGVGAAVEGVGEAVGGSPGILGTVGDAVAGVGGAIEESAGVPPAQESTSPALAVGSATTSTPRSDQGPTTPTTVAEAAEPTAVPDDVAERVLAGDDPSRPVVVAAAPTPADTPGPSVSLADLGSLSQRDSAELGRGDRTSFLDLGTVSHWVWGGPLLARVVAIPLALLELVVRAMLSAGSGLVAPLSLLAAIVARRLSLVRTTAPAP